MSESFIDAEHLGRRYGRRWALADVTFRVPAGAVMMIAGHNGSGKSTLFRVLSTAIRPDMGRVTIGGLDAVRHRYDVRQVTALLSHYSYLYESLTARENLEVTADHMKIGREPVLPLLDRVGLASRSNDAVSTFSAGMRKRLSFARVLMQKPKLVLLDEPYGQLDPAGFDLVDDVVYELKSNGVTVLMATHQVERSAKHTDLALFLQQGRMIWTGPSSELIDGAPPKPLLKAEAAQ